jgi:PAS domain S-box-containing protein
MTSFSRKSKGPEDSSGRRTSPQRVIGEGEMADLIRGFDWSRNPLGPMEGWSDTLVTTVNLLLASRHPMFLWWGPDLIQFYNDGYRPSIRADKHPSAVGQRGVECWPEIWPIIFPQIDAVMARGESTWNTNQLVPINRNGKLEEVYWTYSYSPVRDETGLVRGTMVVCSETTEQVLSERRLRTLLAIAVDSLIESQPPKTRSLIPFAQSIVRKLDDAPADIPFAALYLFVRGDVSLVGCTASAGLLSDPGHWQLADIVESEAPLLVEGLGARFDSLVCRPWPEPITTSFLLPLFLPGSSIQAVLLLGISPRLPFDGSYRTFFEVVGARIAGLLQSEIHQLELAQAGRRFRSLAEADPFGMVIGGLEGDLRYVNPAFLRTLGYSEAEVSSGQVRWDSLTPPEYAQADAKAVEELRTSGRCQVYEKAYLSKDGRRIPILIGASVIDSSGALEVAAFVTDLTPLKVAEEALRKANDDLERKVAQRTAALEAEISDRKRAEFSLRELTGRLLVTQDEERRHMARELHDSAGQTLAALGMNLSVLQTAATGSDAEIARLAAESLRLSDDLTREIRTLSYLLHPPLLDEVGLTSALRWYVDGFAERSKIAVELDLPENAARLPKDLELVIFRVVQESLTNIHRHSGSSSAKIYLRHSGHTVEFEISDRGRGISAKKQQEMTAAKAGVGVRGMQERVRQFGGKLQIVSDLGGTKVIVNLPTRLAVP